MNVQEFQNKLKEIQTIAKANGNSLTAIQIRDTFAGMELDKTQLLGVLKYLTSQGIQIEGMEDSATEETKEPERKKIPLTPEEETYLRNYLEELPELSIDTAQAFAALANGDQDALQSLTSYYMKETIAGDHFVLNPEQKEFTLTAEDDTQAVVYEGVAYKNERQKISISVEKKDAVTEEKLEGVIFGLYAKEDILSQQGEVLVEKDTLLEKKATDEKGQLTFDSDLYHGKYYVKEEVRKPGYLPNEEIWEIDASYIDQNLAEIKLTKEVENQPTKSQFTKTDATTGEELEGAKLQIIDQDGNIVEEWISTKEPHVVYGLPEGTYTLHEELPPYAEGYVSAEDMEFEVKEDGSVTKVEMKDTYSKVEISKTDLTTGKELEGAKLQILNKEGEVLEEWVTDGKPHLVEKLPVGEELILREITAPEGYEIAEDVKFTLEDTMEVQKVEMKDARTPETPGVPQTGDDHWKQILLFALLGVSAAGLMATMLYKKRHKKADEAKKEE